MRDDALHERCFAALAAGAEGEQAVRTEQVSQPDSKAELRHPRHDTPAFDQQHRVARRPGYQGLATVDHAHVVNTLDYRPGSHATSRSASDTLPGARSLRWQRVGAEPPRGWHGVAS